MRLAAARILIPALALSPALALADGTPPTGHRDDARATHRFEDAEHWSAIWDDPSRDAWQQPDAVIEALRIEPGMTVVDIGAGTGYFNPHLSRAVGDSGRVFAADVEPTMVEHMQARAEQERTANVVPVLATPDDPGLPVARIDRVLMVDTFHHIGGRVDYFRRLRAKLRPGGLFVDVDWKTGQSEMGPAERHKIAPEEVIAELSNAGYRLLERRDLKYQYILVFAPEEDASGDPSSGEGAAGEP